MIIETTQYAIYSFSYTLLKQSGVENKTSPRIHTQPARSHGGASQKRIMGKHESTSIQRPLDFCI